MAGHCGSCTMCCNLFPIPELAKPAHTWCSDCTPGRGCNRYETRPSPCVDFACMWLQGMEDPTKTPPPPEMRPDRSKVVMFVTPHDNRMINVLPHRSHRNAWREPKLLEFLKNAALAGFRVLVSYGPTPEKHILVVQRDQHQRVKAVEIRRITMSEPDENGEQFYTGDSGHEPDDVRGNDLEGAFRAHRSIPSKTHPA